MTYSCPGQCKGSGTYSCGDPHADNEITCGRCSGSGKVASLRSCTEAAAVGDVGTLKLLLREQQSQSELDRAMSEALGVQATEFILLLLEAGADVHMSLHMWVRKMLHLGYRYRDGCARRCLLRDLNECNISTLRMIVANGAVASDADMKHLEDALKCYEDDGSQQTKDQLEEVSVILRSAQEKVLNLLVDDACSGLFIVNLQTLGGQCAAVVTISSRMTLLELQKEIYKQASIPRGHQCLVYGNEKIDVQSAGNRLVHELLQAATSS